MWSQYTASCPDLSQPASWPFDASPQTSSTEDRLSSHHDIEFSDEASSSSSSDADTDTDTDELRGSTGPVRSVAGRSEARGRSRGAERDHPRSLERFRHNPASTSIRGCTVQAKRLLDDDATPPELKRRLAHWSMEQGMRAHLMLLEFEQEFRDLAERGGAGEVARFRDEVLPSLRQAAIVCVAMDLDHMPALRDWLDQTLRAEQRVHQYAPLFKLPAQLLGWACAAAAMATAPTLPALRQAARPPGDPDQAQVPWLASTAMMAAAPLLAWMDSVLDAGWRRFQGQGLLRPGAHFINGLAAELHDVPTRSEHRELLHEALTGLALGAVLRVGAGTLASVALPSGLRVRDMLALSGTTEAVSHWVVPKLCRSRYARLDGPSPDTHLRALSSTEFVGWASRSRSTPASRATQIKHAVQAMAHSVLKPSTLLQGAIAVAPFMALRGLTLAPLPYPAGGNILHEHSLDPATRAEGEPVDPLTVALVSSVGTLLAAAMVYASPLIRSLFEERVDPLAERLGRQAWEAWGRGRQSLLSAVGLRRGLSPADQEASIAMIELGDAGVGLTARSATRSPASTATTATTATTRALRSPPAERRSLASRLPRNKDAQAPTAVDVDACAGTAWVRSSTPGSLQDHPTA